jgi:hypothetical protein
MKFEIGKMYKTRDGRKAQIFMPDNGAGHMYGAVSNDRDCWNLHSWYSSGEAHYDERGFEHKKYDLVSEWTEPKKMKKVASYAYRYGKEVVTISGVAITEERAKKICKDRDLELIQWPYGSVIEIEVQE